VLWTRSSSRSVARLSAGPRHLRLAGAEARLPPGKVVLAVSAGGLGSIRVASPQGCRLLFEPVSWEKARRKPQGLP